MLLVIGLVGLGEESLLGECVHRRRNIVRAILPSQDSSCCGVVQANLVHVFVVLSKCKSVRKLLELEVRREVELSELGDALPELRPQCWHLALFLVLVKAALGESLGQLGVKFLPLFHLFCCGNFILGFLWLLQHKVTPVEENGEKFCPSRLIADC